ncbi:MAG TPA: bifunctional phosphoribosyl-AMP cyclohydrolase/phosphoribosyl-ATP diphosphatase HisIE [Methylomusa anaerophila]|uniref:Histidine biosynthesis bifunctional protein HisIE n=1 Tax=Methylomusa anaerophila TaxID=1930071 RepID=A0A348AMR3_9FIRM|nr:bifunctional phosphoribosyl-AMP cyclohydrolase/phosphoribosyl-ATP diphosphatase HisIE [Methylomusa anaerophila]BBB92361.1 phosphoribosyl-ATP pyrophosphatase [Methylomusa anaerophila]HML90000.1 bifunctional phosphoribosyl-AMP cyclohydrolase/phosphoribosyl-ATP diphosphatase HisIE [Methylomusa anaerophila]
MMEIDGIRYDANGLVPAIVQDEATGTVLMLAYMNRESLMKTIATGYTWFYSRSRNSLWHKGETSGHVQKVKDIFYDCDADTLLVKVEQTGVACHEGTFSCFSRKLGQKQSEIERVADPQAEYGEASITILHELYHIINDRKLNPKEGSYTTYLFDKGQDKILKKVGEESAETIIASKNNSKTEILYEMADLWYHCLVLLAYHGITPTELFAELKSRRK